ncbi:seca inner membrane component of sec protein secretion system [Holotrichia oblita]|nr:seca inner membrane component of sec protein secretion system [Holotrichia oblita]
MGLISYIASSDNRKHIKRISVIADKIESFQDKFKAYSDKQLQDMTSEFKKRLEGFETLDDILPEAFAVVRETSTRVLGMTHFRVQLMGGIILHQGRIAEMGTGEGKTLVSTLPAYLNALTGQGVHIVTVNDYLAKRDAEWMGKIHRFLGLTVGVSIAGMTPDEKRAAYNCDITYATNNELGFDYLRDNMVIYKKDMVQRDLVFAIIDEVDSILIDEARTPLIISGRGGKSSDMYVTASKFARQLRPSTNVDDEGKPLEGAEPNGDFEIDLKKKAISLTDKGTEKAERYFAVDSLNEVENTELNHYINNALKAQYVMKKDTDYIVNDGEVIIVDEFTGRLMIGRRYSEGLHQAIEAKEGVRIQSENKTLATITFQNYFRLYQKLSGMTGTAKTEESEFKGIYGLDVVIIPTNVPRQRVDENDVVYTTINGKLKAVLADITECYERGQPVLVGTTTVEKSEELASFLKKSKVPHNVLNAKNHEREAEIVAQAGKLASVTISTNMAGRGTDIMLGGNPEYLAKKRMRDMGMDPQLVSDATSYFVTEDADILNARAMFKKFYGEYKKITEEEKQQVINVGGLRIIGTERHESRRIDNQLRGRAGRQGDMGSSIFYLSMEDDLVRLFGGDRMKRIAEAFKTDEDTPFRFGLLTRQIEGAQKTIEGRNYSVRKQVLEYDDVMNTQRGIIYGERNKVLKGESVHEQIEKMMRSQVDIIVNDFTNPKVDWNEWDYHNLNKEIERKLLPGEPEFFSEERMKAYALSELKDQLFDGMMSVYNVKIRDAAAIGVDFEEIERVLLLRAVDGKWMDHIDSMDVLRRGIGLKAYANQDPVMAYKQEGFEMFDDMVGRIHEDTVQMLMRVNIEKVPQRKQEKLELIAQSGDENTRQASLPNAQRPKQAEIGRNDACPCGSEKFETCCEYFDISALKRREQELFSLQQDPNLYVDLKRAQAVNSEAKHIEHKIKDLENKRRSIADLSELLVLAEEEGARELIVEIEDGIEFLEKSVEILRLLMLLKGEYDANNAIMSIHAGAGGTEAQDWAQMLYRMYRMYADKNDFKIAELDYLDGDEAGLKSVTFTVSGSNAYGFLKAEKGVHRLVRISPFDSNARRHTSFASVEVMPEIENDTEVKINPDELRIDTYRSGGAGGQHINKTDSAVRMTHLPTGIVVQCQSERSQIQNRETAMRMLISKLVEKRERENAEKAQNIKGELKKIEWGSQIRSYVFQPYTLVKDHRTGYESSDIGAVMDGEIEGFIFDFLKKS